METLATVVLPDHGRSLFLPELPSTVYEARLVAATRMARESKLDFLVVYGDREHAANLAYLTGFDPALRGGLVTDCRHRKEETARRQRMPRLPADAALGLEVELFQDFSLMGQSRAISRPLQQILSEFGIAPGSRVGCVGWKYFTHSLLPAGALEVPAYLVDLLRELTSDSRQAINAAAIFMDAANGLRVINEPEQILQFEYAAGVASAGVCTFLQQVHIGVHEQDLEKCLESCGLPLSCHRMVSFGEKARGAGCPALPEIVPFWVTPIQRH